jgi:hypothetical protein
MIIAVFCYEVFMIDSRRVVNQESMEHHRLMSKRLTNGEMKLKKEMDDDVRKTSSSETVSSPVGEKENTNV